MSPDSRNHFFKRCLQPRPLSPPTPSVKAQVLLNGGQVRPYLPPSLPWPREPSGLMSRLTTLPLAHIEPARHAQAQGLSNAISSVWSVPDDLLPHSCCADYSWPLRSSLATLITTAMPRPFSLPYLPPEPLYQFYLGTCLSSASYHDNISSKTRNFCLTLLTDVFSAPNFGHAVSAQQVHADGMNT